MGTESHLQRDTCCGPRTLTKKPIQPASVRAADCVAAGLAHRLDKDRNSRMYGLLVNSFNCRDAHKNLSFPGDEVP